MSQRFDQFREDFRLKLTNIDSGLDGIKTKIDGKGHQAEQDVRNHLDKLKRHSEQERSKVATAQADVKKWADEKKTATDDKIAEWKLNHEKTKLQNRADKAEQYAAAAKDVAFAALDEAEQAALEAWLARQDASSI